MAIKKLMVTFLIPLVTFSDIINTDASTHLCLVSITAHHTIHLRCYSKQYYSSKNIPNNDKNIHVDSDITNTLIQS